MTDTARTARAGVPERPTLDGLEETWARRWQEEGTYAFDRTKQRADVYAIDTPPPTVSGELHMGHVFSYTHTDVVARFQRMRGRTLFYPMGWDDNGLPTERRVQNVYGVRCDPALPYDPSWQPPAAPGDDAAGVPAQPRPGRGLPGGGADPVGRRVRHRRRPGGAGGPRAARRVPPAAVHRTGRA